MTDHGALLTPYRQPLLPQRRAGGDTARNTAAAVAAGLVVGLGLALLVSGRERPGRHGIDIARLTGWPVLASLPRSAHGGASAGTLTSPYAALQTAVEERRRTRGFRTLLVAGVEEGDGATTVAIQLALAASRGGVATTLVDADQAAPSVHHALGIEAGPGLAESLRPPTAVPGVIDPATLPETPLPLQRVDIDPAAADAHSGACRRCRCGCSAPARRSTGPAVARRPWARGPSVRQPSARRRRCIAARAWARCCCSSPTSRAW